MWVGSEKNLGKDVGWCKGQGGILSMTFYFPSSLKGDNFFKNEQLLAPGKVRPPLRNTTRWYYRETANCGPVLRGPSNGPTIKNKIRNGTMDQIRE
jgi:hypothetical protein